MVPPTVTVFVSSTWLDLQPERKAVETALQRMRETEYVGMEYLGNRDESTEQASLDEVGCSQVYVGILAGLYGSGITEAEYRHAHEERQLPCFLYVKDERVIPDQWRETEGEALTKLTKFKEAIRVPGKHTVTAFTSPDDLAAKVTADLHRWLFDAYLPPLLQQAALQGDVGQLRRVTDAVRD